MSIFVAETDRRLFRQHLSLASEGTSVRGIDLRIDPRHRHAFFAEIEVLPVKNEKREVTNLRWLIRDMTERKLEESLLREKDARLRLVVGQIPAILWTTDSELRLISLEGAGLESLGIKGPDAIGLTLDEVMKTGDKAAGHLEPVLGGASVTYEIEASDRYLTCYMEPLRSQNGVIEGCIGVAHDVTDRRHAELALAERELALKGALDREMNASAQLHKINEMKDLLMRTLSHDLRSPLTSVLGYAATLERLPSLDSDQARGMIRRIAGNAQKMEHLVQDLLDLDRLDRRILLPQRSETDLGELARRVLKALDLGKRSVTVEADGVATIDEVKAERILENLIGDCAKHTTRDVPVWIRMTPAEDGGVLIVVEDAGPGFPEDLKQRAFEPFVRGKDAAPSGLGIGLTIVARFAELHGGRAWIEDRPGGGASFHVLLRGPNRNRAPSAAPSQHRGKRSPESSS